MLGAVPAVGLAPCPPSHSPGSPGRREPCTVAGLRWVSVSMATSERWAEGNAAATTSQPSLLRTSATHLQLPLGCCTSSVSLRAMMPAADRHADCLRVTCAQKRGLIRVVDFPACFSNANVAFDVRVFILQLQQNPALDKRSTVPTTVLQQELPSCSLT